MDYSKMLLKEWDIEIDEEFKIKGSERIYKIDKDFNFQTCGAVHGRFWGECNEELHLMINGTYEIVKIPKLTEIDKKARDYFIAIGCPWVARDKDGEICAYPEEPKKGIDCWCDNYIEEYKMANDKCFKFISFDDEEPTDLRTL